MWKCVLVFLLDSFNSVVMHVRPFFFGNYGHNSNSLHFACDMHKRITIPFGLLCHWSPGEVSTDTEKWKLEVYNKFHFISLNRNGKMWSEGCTYEVQWKTIVAKLECEHFFEAHAIWRQLDDIFVSSTMTYLSHAFALEISLALFFRMCSLSSTVSEWIHVQTLNWKW